MRTFDPIRILVVDAEQQLKPWAERTLTGVGRSVKMTSSACEALDLAERLPFDVGVLSTPLPDGDAIGLLQKLQEIVQDVEVVLVAGNGSVDDAVASMKGGACDYIARPFTAGRIEGAVEKAYERVCVKREARRRSQIRSGRSLTQHLIGNSHAMQHVHYLIRKVAPSDVPVLISGESGTGKEVAAMAIHRSSQRAGQPIVVKDCTTFRKDEVMVELFGQCRETLAGTKRSREGLLAHAHKGTLFLDEIGELPLEAQAALLQVMETERYHRVGDHRERRADVRFVFVTGRNLEREVLEGRFLSSLYHRLSAFRIHMCPLRWRKEDISPLAVYFLGLLRGGAKPRRLSKDALECLFAHDWPGNVRELRNILERVSVLEEDGVLTARSLPLYLAARMQGVEGAKSPCSFPELDEVKRAHILHALEYAGGNRTRAARLLGIGRKTLYAKLLEYRLESGRPDGTLSDLVDLSAGPGSSCPMGPRLSKRLRCRGGRTYVKRPEVA